MPPPSSTQHTVESPWIHFFISLGVSPHLMNADRLVEKIKWDHIDVSASPATTTEHRLVGLNTDIYFTVLEARSRDQGISRSESSWLADGHLLIPPEGREQRAKQALSLSSHKGTNPIQRSPSLWPNYFPKPHLLNTSTLDKKEISTFELCGDGNIQSTIKIKHVY